VTRHRFPLKLVLTATYLLYIRLPLFIDTDPYSQLPDAIKSLKEFVTKHKDKLHSFGLDPRAFGFLERGYRGLLIYWKAQNIQVMVDGAILSLLPVLFSYEAFKAFGLEDVSNLFPFGLEKIEKNNVYDQILATMNVLIDHWDPSFDVLENELKKIDSFFSRTSVVQPLDDIQKESDEIKVNLILIKDVFQTQVNPESVNLCSVWMLSLSFVKHYSQQSVRIRRLVCDQFPEAVDFYIGLLNFHSEFSFLKLNLTEIKEMAKKGNLSEYAFQSLLNLVPLIDSHFFEWRLGRSWTTDDISKFRMDVRTMFDSELCPLIRNKFPLVLDDEIIDPLLTIEKCMADLLDPAKSELDRHKIESYMVSKFTSSELVKAYQSNQNHPVFKGRLFLNKLARTILNHEVKTILAGGMGPDLNDKLKTSKRKLLPSGFVRLFNLDRKSPFTLCQQYFAHLKLSPEYFLNEDIKFYLDFIEPWVFSLDNPYGHQMCDVIIGLLVDLFLPKLIPDFPTSDPYVFLELCDNYFYKGYRSNVLCFSDGLHRVSLDKLDESSFPLADYFFTLLYDLLSSASLTQSEYMDIIRRHIYESPHLPPHFRNKLYQKKLYLDLIVRGMAAPDIPSIFAFEDFSPDVFSVILSYVDMDINSARNMLLASNVFYFGTRGYLTHYRECL
jgi:hypothetical protein